MSARPFLITREAVTLKRALASFTLVLLFLPALLALLSLERSMHESHARSLQAVLGLEERRSFELEAKAALKSALAALPREGLTRAQRSALAGERVAAWAAWLEARAARSGFRARAWCGPADEEGLGALLSTMLERGEALTCTGCLRPSLFLPDGEGTPVRACSGLLEEGLGGQMEVSRAGLVRVPLLAHWALPHSFVGLGASVHSPRSGWSSLFLLPEGFRGGFSHG